MNAKRKGAANAPSPSANLNHWCIVRECKKVASDFEFYGDPLEDNYRCGSTKQELAIGGILASLPGRIRKMNPAFTRQVVKNIVRNEAWS